MSWSDERAKEDKRSAKEIIEKITVVNAVLRKLAMDSDLTEDLNDTTVQIAIKHWTNEKRLNVEDAKLLEDNYRVLAVLKKLVRIISAPSLFPVRPDSLDRIFSNILAEL
jgi:hypothetical protein